jgi:hypothetical protein
MPEIAYSIASSACIVLAYLWRRAANHRDVARAERDIARDELTIFRADLDLIQSAKDALAYRVEVLRGDNEGLVNRNIHLSGGNTRLLTEVRDLKASAIKRDPATGQMLPSPDAKRPRKSRAKTAPIACG